MFCLFRHSPSDSRTSGLERRGWLGDLQSKGTNPGSTWGKSVSEGSKQTGWADEAQWSDSALPSFGSQGRLVWLQSGKPPGCAMELCSTFWNSIKPLMLASQFSPSLVTTALQSDLTKQISVALQVTWQREQMSEWFYCGSRQTKLKYFSLYPLSVLLWVFAMGPWSFGGWGVWACTAVGYLTPDNNLQLITGVAGPESQLGRCPENSTLVEFRERQIFSCPPTPFSKLVGRQTRANSIFQWYQC